MADKLTLAPDPEKPNHYLLLLNDRAIAGGNSIGLMQKEVKRVKGQYKRRKLALEYEDQSK